MKPKILVVLAGIQGSGKSTYARFLKKEFGNPVCKILSRDTIRETMFVQPYHYQLDNEKTVTTIFNDLLQSYVLAPEVGIIVLDNTHCKESYIDCYRALYPDTTVYVEFFDLPLWKAWTRNIIRRFTQGKHKYVPWSIIRSFKKNYDKINKEKYAVYM